MKDILSPPHRAILEEFAWSNVLIAFDFDGTLAPIAPLPEQARIRDRTRELLTTLSTLFRVVVISGRAQRDALRKLQGIPVAAVVGNHGVERWHSASRLVSVVEGWLPVLRAATEGMSGVTVEDKIFSLAVHYRQSREKKRVRAAITRAVAGLGDVRTIAGKQVVNILPTDAPHKGIALERERDRFRCDTAIYVGDDEADEDVFALDQPGRLLTVRVGAKGSSAASYFVRRQTAVDSLMRVLVESRLRWAAQRRAAR